MTHEREKQLSAAVQRAERTGTDAQLANALDHLAVFLHEAGEYARAAPVYGRALGLWRQILGPAHPSIGTLMVNLAAIYHHLGDLDAAEPLYRQALTIFEADVEFDDPGAIASLEAFVGTLARDGRADDAGHLAERVQRVSIRLQDTVTVKA